MPLNNSTRKVGQLKSGTISRGLTNIIYHKNLKHYLHYFNYLNQLVPRVVPKIPKPVSAQSCAENCPGGHRSNGQAAFSRSNDKDHPTEAIESPRYIHGTTLSPQPGQR